MIIAIDKAISLTRYQRRDQLVYE